MSSDTVKKAKEIWMAWDVRVLILISLLLQFLLTFLAPRRKRSASGLLKFTLWLLYLSASAVALYIISQITSNPDDDLHDKANLFAFWAPCLLLHLGGPDTITALELEDNELWHRHALELATQLGVTLYVFINSLVRPKNQLWGPTALIFVDGCIKYFERTQALYYASIGSFRGSLETHAEPGPNYARLMDLYSSSAVSSIPTEIQARDERSSSGVFANFYDNPTADEEGTPTPNNDFFFLRETPNNDFKRVDTCEMIIEAYSFYNKFKGLLAYNFLSMKERKECRDVFVAKKGAEAVRIIEIELNLIYDVFYTKAFLLKSKQAYLRVISSLSVIASLVWFSFLDKSRYRHEIDVVITYILLGGAIALDVSAVVMFVMSDWFIIIVSDYLKQHPPRSRWAEITSTFILKMFLKRRLPGGDSADRWSRSISEYNLLRNCFKDPLRRIKDALIGLLYVQSDNFEEEIILKFVVEELQKKAKLVHEDHDDDLRLIKEVCSARGNLILEDDYCLISHYLQPWTTDVDYDESLLTWHLATDICYHTRTKYEDGEEVLIGKNLSDYMSYLLLRQQTLVSSVVGMSDKRFKDTCAEATKFMMNKRLDSWYSDICVEAKSFMYKVTCRGTEEYELNRREKESKFFKDFCEHLLEACRLNEDVWGIVAMSDKSNSVLFEACRLAKQLKMLGDEKQWKIICKVWLELMCYAAVRCSPRSHVAQLNRGGELVTLVWLLMAHLGFGEHLLQNRKKWIKLIIQK